MGKPYKVCDNCGSHLDAGEICDCKREQEAAKLIDIRGAGTKKRTAEHPHYGKREAG